MASGELSTPRRARRSSAKTAQKPAQVSSAPHRPFLALDYAGVAGAVAAVLKMAIGKLLNRGELLLRNCWMMLKMRYVWVQQPLVGLLH
jgi:hypothetical protein